MLFMSVFLSGCPPWAGLPVNAGDGLRFREVHGFLAFKVLKYNKNACLCGCCQGGLQPLRHCGSIRSGPRAIRRPCALAWPAAARLLASGQRRAALRTAGKVERRLETRLVFKLSQASADRL